MMEADAQGSRIPGFYNLSLAERLDKLAQAAGMEREELSVFEGDAGLSNDQANHMIENVVGRHALPLGIALNFIVNGREVLVPMAVEEPSVVAGASFMAKLARQGGGFQAHVTQPEMIGQMQVLDVPDLHAARVALLAEKSSLLAEAGEIDPVLKALGVGRETWKYESSKLRPSAPLWWYT
jgi:hydroxymethylglutaryl-CoA reductase